MKLLCLLFVLTSVCFAQVNTIDSDVIEATVFKDRAMVTRSAEVTLQKGMNEIVFSDLTADILDESINISTEGGRQIKILDVKVERKFTAEIRKEKIKTLQKEINALKNELRIAQDNISILDSKLNFVESLKAESITYANQKILMSTSSPKEWNDLLKFVDINLTEIFKRKREEENKKTLLEQEIRTLQLSMEQSNVGEERNYKEIIVKIESGENGKFTVKPSYIVNSANWYPIYDARVSSESKECELSYFAMIHQSTGEDWNDVKLTFSTANPLSVKSLPKLDPWFLDVNRIPQSRPNKSNLGSGNNQGNISYDQNWGLSEGFGAVAGYITDVETGEPLMGANVILANTNYGSTADINGKFYIANVPASNYTLQASFIGYKSHLIRLKVEAKHVANLNFSLDVMDIEMEEMLVTDSELRESKVNASRVSANYMIVDDLPEYSDISAKNISTTFELKTKNSIPSDNSAHKVTIAISKLPINFEYTCIPKIIPKVYIKGRAINNNDYPLLQGEINIFVDNDFVNRTYIQNIVPSDSLELALGIDESIQAERILKNRFVDSKGLFGGTDRITYDYEIQITNTRKTEEEIWIYDQLPVARNEDIKIEVITPSEEDLVFNRYKEIEWQIKLNPGEKKIIPLKFTVEYPSDIKVYGLE